MKVSRYLLDLKTNYLLRRMLISKSGKVIKCGRVTAGVPQKLVLREIIYDGVFELLMTNGASVVEVANECRCCG